MRQHWNGIIRFLDLAGVGCGVATVAVGGAVVELSHVGHRPRRPKGAMRTG